jgi:hypothetical protein
MNDFKAWWNSIPHEFFANASYYEYAENAFKEARKGYVKLDDVLEIVEILRDSYNKDEDMDFHFRVGQIKALGDKDE